MKVGLRTIGKVDMGRLTIMSEEGDTKFDKFISSRFVWFFTKFMNKKFQTTCNLVLWI